MLNNWLKIEWLSYFIININTQTHKGYKATFFLTLIPIFNFWFFYSCLCPVEYRSQNQVTGPYSARTLIFSILLAKSLYESHSNKIPLKQGQSHHKAQQVSAHLVFFCFLLSQFLPLHFYHWNLFFCFLKAFWFSNPLLKEISMRLWHPIW